MNRLEPGYIRLIELLMYSLIARRADDGYLFSAQ